MNLKELVSAIEQIAEEKGIEKKRAMEAVEAALAAAYKKEYRKRSEMVRARLNTKTGEVKFVLVKTVVLPEEVRIDEPGEENEAQQYKNASVYSQLAPSFSKQTTSSETEILPRYNPDRHIFLEEAHAVNPEAKAGDDLDFPLDSLADFGRISAQTAKQVVLQNLREAEKEAVKRAFADKEGQIVSGIVQRFDRGNVNVDLGRAFGIMFSNESIPGEHYRIGSRIRFLVLAVQEEERQRPGIILSRAHPDFIKKLFELEVPEIADGIVEIKEIAREPGNRTKIAVFSRQDNIDPIGAVVGQRGTRVMAVTNELGIEKIDVIEWSEDPEQFVGNALSPAKVKMVEVLPRREARVLVQEDQLSLAIGKSGQNVRLAAKLTGWKIDVRSQSRPDEEQEGGVAEAPGDNPMVEGQDGSESAAVDLGGSGESENDAISGKS